MKATRSDLKSLSRLPQQAAFDRLRKSSTRWVSESVVVQTLPIENNNKSKGLLISVSRKTAPRAVDRSRLRRRLRAVTAEVLPQNAPAGYHYAVIARAQTMGKSHELIKKDLLWCLKRLALPERGEAPTQTDV